MSDRVSLTELPREISALNGGRTPTYREVYNACVDAKIPADKGDNGRWTVLRRNVPMIAKILSGRAKVGA
jgi:hypothetical protein